MNNFEVVANLGQYKVYSLFPLRILCRFFMIIGTYVASISSSMYGPKVMINEVMSDIENFRKR